jgi:prepilin-type N-terminal cleavage/methylation domain-containing protein
MVLSKTGKIKLLTSPSGFSLVELVVVMFILSFLAFLSIPIFKAPAQKLAGAGKQSRNLALFIESVKQQAVKEHKSYLLHLDLVSGRAWAGPQEKTDGSLQKDAEPAPTAQPAISLEGLSLSGVEFSDQTHRQPEDTAIRISGRGISDMALIHMATGNGGITLKLHPFIYKVEIIQGDYTFNDCQ